MSGSDNVFQKQYAPSNPALESAMSDVAKNDNPKTRESLYKTLLASTLIMPGDLSGGAVSPDGTVAADPNTRIEFRTIEHPPGNVVLPVFTDIEALSSFAGSDAQWLGLRSQELFRSILSTSIAELRLNPFRTDQKITRPGGVITRHEFTALAQGLLPGPRTSNVARMEVAPGQKLTIDAPIKEPPAQLLAQLSSHLKQIAALRAAYLFQMTNGDVSSTVIGLDFHAEPRQTEMEQIILGIGHIVGGHVSQGMSVDLMPLQPGALLENVRKCGKALVQN